MQQINLEALQHYFVASVISSNFPVNRVNYSLQFLFYFVLLGVGAYILIALIRKLLQVRHSLKKSFTLLELKPPKTTNQNPYTTQQLFSLIHSLLKQRNGYEKFIGFQPTYGLEIVSTKETGIRYLLRVEADDVDIIKKSLLSYLPGMSVERTSDYLKDNQINGNHILSQYKLRNHFAYPLKDQTTLDKHDPIAYFTGNMTKLDQDEMVTFQLVVSSVDKHKVSDIKRISQLIYANRDLTKSISSNSATDLPLFVFKSILYLALQCMLLPVGLLVMLLTEGKEGPFLKLPTFSDKKPENPYQQELETMIKGKLDQDMFYTSMRLLVTGKDQSSLRRRVKGFNSSVSPFNNAGYQSLVPTKSSSIEIIRRLQKFQLKYRMLNLFGNSILSTNEVGDIYHLPFTSTTKTEDLQKVHSKQLPAPIGLKQSNNLDIAFAKNTYGGTTTPIGLTEDERRRHMYVLGATGTGKSTMLLSMIKQDIDHGKGLCVIDPHGDLIENILPQIPDERIKDVVYFNPDDISYPMGINLLERTPGLNPEDDLKEKEFITESIISLFHKIYSDKYSGPRMEYILRNTIHTAFTLENPTLFTIYKLLINPKFRKSVTKNVTDEHLKDFWKYEFSQAGNYQKVKMISPITNKIGRFLFSPSAKRILEQEKSTINFDQIMDEGKILLCNVSKGRIGEDNSEVFGVVVMAKIQLAALKRARRREVDRKDFYLYVDEFQNFATEAFGQILSEARKYKLNAILAHQTTSQLEDKSLVNITLANTGTVICFRTANPEDEKLILPQFAPYIEKGEIASLPSYHFYMRLGALNPEEPFSGTTIPIKSNGRKSQAKKVINSSRKLYAMKFDESSQPHQEVKASQTKIKQSQKRAAATLP